MYCASYLDSQSGWLRPKKAKIISWETVLFQFARWPWVLAGGLNAIISWVLDKELQFKVTPKGTNTPKFLPLKCCILR